MFKKFVARYMSTLSIILLFIFVSTSSIAAHNTKQVLHTVRDTILIASEPSYPPFCIVDEEGNADGFSVDLIKAVAEVMHLNIQIKVGPWAEIKQELVEGKIDVLPMVGRSPEREEVYDFTFPYHTMNGAVFVREGTKGIETLDDLKHRDLAVMKGDNAHEFATRVKLSDKIHTTETYDIAFQELSEGNYDAVIAQKLMGLQLLNELNIHNVQALDIKLTDFNQDFSFAVQDGNKNLLAVLNEGLSIIIANGTYDELHKKWWSPITISGISFKQKLTMLVPYLVSIIIIIAIIGIVTLKLQVKRRTLSLRKEIAVRKKTEDELRESEITFRELFENMSTGVAIYEAIDQGNDFVFKDVNKAGERIDNIKKENLLGKSLLKMYPGVKELGLLDSIQNVWKTGKPEHLPETHYKDKRIDGWRENYIYKIPSGEVVVIYKDITKRKQAEEALRISNENTNTILKKIQVGVVVIGKDRKIKMINDTALKLAGVETPDNILGKNCSDYLCPAQQLECPILDNGQKVDNSERILRRKDGREIPILKTVAEISLNGEDVLLETFIDITKRKQAEEELKVSRERLKTASSILRHDLTNDLVVIKSAVKIFKRDPKQEMIDEIEKRVEKSIETINNQRDQIQFLDSHADLDKYDLKELAQKVVSNYQDLDCTIKGNCVTYADNALYSVFDNIVNNAVRHGKTTKLDIEIISNKENCEIRFKDYGIGVSDKIKDKVFDEDFHYGETGHTGIGLFIVKKTIEEYGGMVFVEDNEPNGAVFVIRMKKAIAE